MNVSDEAVEAAARVTFEGLHDDEEWVDVTPAERVPYIDQARQALEAAAPHIAAGALESAAEIADLAVGHIASREGVAHWLRARAESYRSAVAA